MGRDRRGLEVAQEKRIPFCQDTGYAVLFFELGQEVRIVGGTLRDAANEGVRQGYSEGYLRNSLVRPGDRVILSGAIYTARDAAHQRGMSDAVKEGVDLPFDPTGQIVYYVGPTPARPGAGDRFRRAHDGRAHGPLRTSPH